MICGSQAALLVRPYASIKVEESVVFDVPAVLLAKVKVCSLVSTTVNGHAVGPSVGRGVG